jgi:hypothetical protein
MLPHISESAEWFRRGFHMFSAGHFWASLFGSGVIVAGVIHPLIDWMGPVGFAIFFVCVWGLVGLGVAAVLGYQDPLSPWQLAKRFQRLASRVARFNEEMRRETNTAHARAALTETMQEQQERAIGRTFAETAKWRAQYFMRIGPELGALVEDLKDADYEVPAEISRLSETRIVSSHNFDDMTRTLAMTAERLRRRQIKQNAGGT